MNNTLESLRCCADCTGFVIEDFMVEMGNLVGSCRNNEDEVMAYLTIMERIGEGYSLQWC